MNIFTAGLGPVRSGAAGLGKVRRGDAWNGQAWLGMVGAGNP